MMNWESLLTIYRNDVKEDLSTIPPGRTAFNTDIDRITFSNAFRRLGRKTQVHPLAQNDHVHTRLTHSLEVASVGRTLGLMVGTELVGELPSWVSPLDFAEIVMAACLAHDIGNPPFGHAGEEAVRDWFVGPIGTNFIKDLRAKEKTDFVIFEGNALSFRMVTKTEYYRAEGGMRLTYPTLAAMLKYPWTSIKADGDSKKKYSCFCSEIHLMNSVGEKLNLIRKGDDHWCRHPLSYLMEAADDICYSILDLEDAIEMGILRVKEDIVPALSAFADRLPGEMLDRDKIGIIRSRYIRGCIEDIANVFLVNRDMIMNGNLPDDLISHCSDETKMSIASAKKLAREKVFNEKRKLELELGSYSILSILLDAFIGAAHQYVRNSGNISIKNKQILQIMGLDAPREGDDLYGAYMKVMNFVGGMTDNYATNLAGQLVGAFK